MSDLQTKKLQPDQPDPQFEMREVDAFVDSKWVRIGVRSVEIFSLLIFATVVVLLAHVTLSKDTLTGTHVAVIAGLVLISALVTLVVVFKKKDSRASPTEKSPRQTSEPGDAD